MYSANFPFNPFVSFDSIKNSLESGDYQILSQNNETMKIKVAKVIDLDFISKDKLLLDELRQ
jgi:hypothetical protein